MGVVGFDNAYIPFTNVVKLYFYVVVCIALNSITEKHFGVDGCIDLWMAMKVGRKKQGRKGKPKNC